MANTLLINRTALGTFSGGQYPNGHWNSVNDPNINNLDYGELAWNNGTQKLLIARVSDNTGGKTLTPIVRMQGTDNQIAVTESSGTFTVGLPTSISLSNNVTVGNDLSVAGDIVVTGDLTVNGSQTTINSTVVTIDDKSFVVADGQSALNCDAAGYFISDVASIIYEHTGTKLQARVGASLGPFEASTITATTFVGGNVSEWDSAYSDRMKWDGGSSGLNAGTARASLDLEIGTDVQAYDADLTALAGLANTNGNFIVGNGSAWVAESGSTARASLGLGTSAVLNTAAVSSGATTLSTGDQIHTFVTTVTIDGGTF